MSSIPYNYGSYIDAKVSMTDTGHVSAGKQIQSPASAGSRGLAKTTQFTNDRTQMQMGNSPIAESMIEIRNIMNRIDGINVPTNEMNELADDDKMEYTKVMLDISAIKDRVERLSVGDEAKRSALQSLTNAEEALVALDESAVKEDAGEQALANEIGLFFVKKAKEMLQSMERPNKNDQEYEEYVDIAQAFKKGIQAGLDEVNMSDFEFSNNPFGDFGRGMDDGPDEEMVKILAKHGYQPGPDGANDKATIVRQRDESVSDELGRLKELSGIREDDNESKYYEYTGKDFAIKPSGESVWANKANIPSVINVESIMISHYPDMDDYVELTMEHDGPWEIYTDKAVEAALEKTLGMPSGSIKWSEQGQQEKGRAHFDVASTAIGKVSSSSMFKQVRAEESFKPFPEGDEFDIEEDEDFEEVLGPLGFPEDETELFDAEYQGRKVPLNKPMRGDVKKFKVYVKDPKTGNVKKVNFGHGGTSAKRPTMRIRKSNPKARKSFRARHNCANPGPKTKARYWSCRKW